MATTTAPPSNPGLRRVRQLAILAWLTVFVPFVITVINGGPTGGLLPHGIYHLVYVAIIGAAATVLWQWRDASPHRGTRGVIAAVLVLQALAVVGHVGEAISAVMDGSYDEDGTVIAGDEGVHTFFANITVPALAASILLLFVLTGVLLRQRQRH